ncbi:MAG: hypothetical protein Q8J97_06955, partial [Flavobacteriaceae bacterium]|nr:hypothetical protein [Flavobacteriaceae bacterium]
MGDYVMQLDIAGTSRDAQGMFTIAAWVRLTDATRGFVAAKVDAAFYSDGAIPALEAAMFDAEDRYAEFEDLRLPRDNYSVYFGVFANGPKRRVDVVLMNPDKRPAKNSAGGGADREDWLVVRHFRLGDEVGALLFDGEWRFLSLQFKRSTGNFDGQIYVDGKTAPTDPNFVQCFPWLPAGARAPAPQLSDPLVTDVRGGAAMVFGYRLRGSLDEIRIHDKDLQHTTIVDIGGEIFKRELEIDTTALLAVGIVGIVCFVAGIVLLVARGRQRAAHAAALDALHHEIEKAAGEKLAVASPVHTASPLFKRIAHADWEPAAQRANLTSPHVAAASDPSAFSS